MLGVIGAVEGYSYAGQSKYAPIAVMLIATLCATAWAAQSALNLARGEREHLSITKGGTLRFLAVIGATIIFVLAMTYVGFFTSVAMMVPGLAYLLGYRNWVGLLIGTASFILVLYLVFRTLLSVPLPNEVIFKLFEMGT